jgi:LPS-assembly protein
VAFTSKAVKARLPHAVAIQVIFSNVRIIFWLLFLSCLSVATAQTPGTATPNTGAEPNADGVLVPGLRVSPSLGRSVAPEKAMPMFIEAAQLQGDGKNNMSMQGNAVVRRQDSVLKASIIDYNKGTGVMDAQINARLIRDGNIISGTGILYKSDDGTATVDQPNFWIENGGAGVGSWADVYNKNQMSLTDVTYSGCPCPQPSWYIEAEKLDLDFTANEGVAKNGVLYFKDFPILASPYLSFPIKKERKSGFLLPTFGATSTTGVDFTQPYYFNISPTMDMTVQMRAMSKRGLQYGDEFRYMGEKYVGMAAGTYLNHDMKTGMDRWMYTANHTQSLGSGFLAGYNVSGVSDDNYFNDFATIAVNQATTTYLPRMAFGGWGDEFWQTAVQVQTYQTLRPPGTSVAPIYNKVPELLLNGARFDVGGFDVQSQNTLTRFEMPLDQRFPYGPDGSLRYKPDGSRASSYSSIAYPIVRPGWYVTPKIALSATQYQTDWYGLENWYGYGQASNSRVLPIMSVDSGMTFDRDTTFFGKPAVQTLEPRAYYLKVPYVNQSQFPVYDTTLADFSFSQAFQENIYAGGWDRIANADQATLALTTRWMDQQTGFERFSFGVAQRYYFENQKVTLPFEVPRTNANSEFLIGTSAALTDKINASATFQYDPYSNLWDRAQIVARWRPQRLAMLSMSYRYQINPSSLALYQTQGQNQVSGSFQWPLAKKWYSVGRVDYSFNRVQAQSIIDPTVMVAMPKVTQAVLGVEYKGDCCWSGRVVFQQYVVSADQTNTAVFFQLELGGIGNLGQNPMGVIGRAIPGYEAVTPAVPNISKFERYE